MRLCKRKTTTLTMIRLRTKGVVRNIKASLDYLFTFYEQLITINRQRLKYPSILDVSKIKNVVLPSGEKPGFELENNPATNPFICSKFSFCPLLMAARLAKARARF